LKAHRFDFFLRHIDELRGGRARAVAKSRMFDGRCDRRIATASD
jgi:hypothetical protein